jgi:hypothetical protein
MQRRVHDLLIKPVTSYWNGVFRLIEAMREQMFANDYRVIWVSAGEPYDPELIKAPGRPPHIPHTVLSTSNLGLERLESGVVFNETRTETRPGQPRITRIVLPEVNLQYILDEIFASSSSLPLPSK